MPRRVEQDLERQPTLQPTVTPRDDYQQIHEQRLNLTPWGALSKSLTNSLATWTDMYGDQQNALGQAEFSKTLAAAEQEHGDMAQAFAQAVSKGAMKDSHNPFFVTGYRRAIA